MIVQPTFPSSTDASHTHQTSEVSHEKRTLPHALHPYSKMWKWRSLVRHLHHKLHFVKQEGKLWVKAVTGKRRQWVKQSRVLKVGLKTGCQVLVKRIGRLIQKKNKARNSAMNTQNMSQRHEDREILTSPLVGHYDLLTDDHKLMSPWSIHTDSL